MTTASQYEKISEVRQTVAELLRGPMGVKRLTDDIELDVSSQKDDLGQAYAHITIKEYGIDGEKFDKAVRHTREVMEARFKIAYPLAGGGRKIAMILPKDSNAVIALDGEECPSCSRPKRKAPKMAG